MTAQESMNKLLEGNRNYIARGGFTADISPEKRLRTAATGQSPYAIVVACSDSRVIPEVIFSAGIGDLFVIRVAGNVIDNHQLGSIEYAAEHLHTPLVLILGHTRCGAVGAAVAGGAEGYVRTITDEILTAIGEEKDDYKAGCLNVKHSVDAVRTAFSKHPLPENPEVLGAMYNIETGEVEIFGNEG